MQLCNGGFQLLRMFLMGILEYKGLIFLWRVPGDNGRLLKVYTSKKKWSILSWKLVEFNEENKNAELHNFPLNQNIFFSLNSALLQIRVYWIIMLASNSSIFTTSSSFDKKTIVTNMSILLKLNISVLRYEQNTNNYLFPHIGQKWLCLLFATQWRNPKR